MAKTKSREIIVKESKGSFTILKNKSSSKKDYDFTGLVALRHLLSNEKARIINVIKTRKPESIYQLAKLLNRNFKAVRDDLTLLERFGFIEFIEEKTKNRIRHKPILIVDSILIKVTI